MKELIEECSNQGIAVPHSFRDAARYQNLIARSVEASLSLKKRKKEASKHRSDEGNPIRVRVY
jgi:hypothetical protein